MLEDLPDAALHVVLSFLNVRELGSVRRLCSSLDQGASETDDLWRPLFRFTYPVDFVSADALETSSPWYSRLKSWVALQDRWRAARSGCTQAVDVLSSQSLFCMNSLGDGRFACTGAEGVVRVLSPTASGGIKVVSEWDTGGVGHLGLSVDIAAQTLVTCG